MGLYSEWLHINSFSDQTCDPNTTCVFSTAMTLQSNFDICKQVFKIGGDEVYTRVDFTNDYYGSNKPKGTRILFVNGKLYVYCVSTG